MYVLCVKVYLHTPECPKKARTLESHHQGRARSRLGDSYCNWQIKFNPIKCVCVCVWQDCMSLKSFVEMKITLNSFRYSNNPVLE